MHVCERVAYGGGRGWLAVCARLCSFVVGCLVGLVGWAGLGWGIRLAGRITREAEYGLDHGVSYECK